MLLSRESVYSRVATCDGGRGKGEEVLGRQALSLVRGPTVFVASAKRETRVGSSR